MGQSKIDVTGYTLDNVTFNRNKGTWRLLDDRILFHQKSFAWLFSPKEVYLREIPSVDVFGGEVKFIRFKVYPGVGYWEFVLECKEPDQLEIAIPYIQNNHGDKYEKASQLRRKINALNEQVLNGQWNFPCDEFFHKCQSANIDALTNEFSVKKATKIAEEIMGNLGIDMANCGEYLKRESLESYLKKGKNLAREENEKKTLAQKQPQNAKPTSAEREFLVRSKELCVKTGCEKRVNMLSNLLADYNSKISALHEGEKALRQLGMIYADQQKKEADWAIIGGIAEGIAGPAAGLAAAVNTMESNAKIREHNAAIRKASMDIMSGIPSLAGDRYKLEEEKEIIGQQLCEAENKVVLTKPSAKDIWKNIQLGKIAVKRNQSGVLELALPIAFKAAFVLDVPKGIDMVVDGTIKGEVWFEDQLVGDVYFPLPLYGIPSNMTVEVTLDGMCDRSVELDGEYIVRIADTQNLWIMEA